MACAVKDLIEWLKTLPEDAGVAVDDGGLTLVELDDDGEETGNYHEVGGIPLDEDEDV
jgi:hypothetical protein